jgi:hypothetical protein
VGATIVSEVFVGLVYAITSRTYGQRGTDWKLELPSQKAGTFQMTDLLRLVGDVSPIDGITTV